MQVHQIHQIDLVDMTNLKVECKGNTYKYILSSMDVFSRYHWLCPLGRKRSLDVKREVKKIYDVHGLPHVIQSDNGGEFKGKFEDYCRDSKIKMIKSRPYNPKAQGKVERSHRVLRKKILYDMLSQKNSGVNWVRNIPQYMKTLTKSARN